MFSKKLSYIELKEKYNLPSKVSLNIRLDDSGFFIVTSEDLPGLITEARDNKELIENINDAILTYFDVPKKYADIIFDTVNIDGYGIITNLKNNKITI